MPGVLSAQELSALPHAELALQLAEAYQLIGRLQARVEELERQVRQDSSNVVAAAVVGQPVPEEAARPFAAGAGEAAAG